VPAAKNTGAKWRHPQLLLPKQLTPNGLKSDQQGPNGPGCHLKLARQKQLLSFPQLFPQLKGYLAKAISALLESKN
jgi:hypothetical protein